jgi:ribonuclease HII
MIDRQIEGFWSEAGVRRLAGVDEVGRGPLAGPVVAAAVILPEGFEAEDITDSKRLSATRRQTLAVRIIGEADVGLAMVPAPVIDALNIHHATLLAMRRAVLALAVTPEFVLIDGKFVPPGLPCRAEAIVKGDSRVLAIAAASIIAKVVRDRLMAEADHHFPGYGFSGHAGYPAPAHKAALGVLGISPLHRMSYAPCRAAAGLQP